MKKNETGHFSRAVLPGEDIKDVNIEMLEKRIKWLETNVFVERSQKERAQKKGRAMLNATDEVIAFLRKQANDWHIVEVDAERLYWCAVRETLRNW